MGKARNLRNRISSYRRKSDPNRKTRLLLSQAMRLKWTREKSDLEAVLTEAEMIRAHQPKFNIRLKDGKTPLYILIANEEFPRVFTARKTQLPTLSGRRTTFGPYPSAFQAKKVLKLARKAFPFCNASPVQKKRKKACFYAHLNLCPGACTGKVTKKEYAQNINNLRLFLTGKRRKIVKEIEKEMKEAAKDLRFEKAGELKDQLDAILMITQSPSVATWEETAELTDNKQEKARVLLWKTLAPLIARTNSQLPKNPFARIEAYDISNLSGKQATGAMIVFTNGQPDPAQYRRFRIRFTSEPDDPSMLYETLIRRIKHRKWRLPELIVVDGGKAQVKAVKQALATAGLHHRIPVVGIAKRFEHIILKKQVYHVLKLPTTSPALKLIMHLRDEAHRFAKGYHTLLRQKEFTSQTQSR